MSNQTPKTNEEFLIEAMNYSRFGVVSQCIIMQGVEGLIDAIIEQEKDLITKYEKDIEDGKHPFMNMYSWVGAAKELREKLDNMRKRNG